MGKSIRARQSCCGHFDTTRIRNNMNVRSRDDMQEKGTSQTHKQEAYIRQHKRAMSSAAELPYQARSYTYPATPSLFIAP
jgi:hypothetical protein